VASLVNMVEFLFDYIWVKKKSLLIYLILSLPMYFINSESQTWKFVIINLFIFNLVLLYTLSLIDKNLVGFYRLFRISSLLTFITKIIILGGILFIHLILLLSFTLKLRFQPIIAILSILISLCICKMVAEVKKKSNYTILTFVFLNSLISVSYLLQLKFLQFMLFCGFAFILGMVGYFQFKSEQNE